MERAQVRVAQERMPRMPTSPRAKKKNPMPQLHAHVNNNRNSHTRAHAHTTWAGKGTSRTEWEGA